MAVIANTTVISNFASVGQLSLLRDLFERVEIPVEVLEEIEQGLDEGYRFYQAVKTVISPPAKSGWIHLTATLTEEELRLRWSLSSALHSGEASCIAIAKQRNWLLLTDDRRARREAKRLAVRTSGSIGCLIAAIEKGLCNVEQANIWLKEMIKFGYYAPVTDLTPFLKR